MSSNGNDLRDVIVIGGGPAGSHTAAKLAQCGLNVAVLEQKPELGGDVCCAGIISRRCLERFAIDESLVIKRLNGSSVYSPKGNKIRLWRRQTQACLIDRAAFDLNLAGKAKASGAEYVLGASVNSIDIGRDAVEVTYEGVEGKKKEKAKAAVVACGFNQKFIDSLKLGSIEDSVIGVQTEVALEEDNGIEVYTGREIAPGFFSWLAPYSEGKARLGLLVRKNPKKHLSRLLDRLIEQGKITGESGQAGYRRIPIKTLPRTYSRRLLVVGDAAGQTKPTTGGGIYFGLIAAEMAAARLNKAIREDDLSARALSGYQRAWKKEFGRDIKLGSVARVFYEKLNDKQLEELFSMISRDGVIDELLEDEGLSFDGHGKLIIRLAGKKMFNSLGRLIKAPFHSEADKEKVDERR